jgi:clan AA aspartic protease (TIGR02281 family)
LHIKAFCTAALIAAAAFGLARPALADCKMVQVAELPLDSHWYGVVVDGQINGKPVKVVVDTGSSLSMISQSVAKTMGLAITRLKGVTLYGVGGQTDAYGTTVKSLQIGQLVANNINLIGSTSLTDPKIAMILGNDILSQFDVEFDLAGHAMRLFKPEGCTADQLVYWNKPYSLAPLLGTVRDSPSIRTTVSLNGQRIAAELDTGAGSSVVDVSVANRVGVVVDNSVATQPARGMGEAPRPVTIGQFKSFALGDEQIGHVRIELIRLVADMQTNDLDTDTRIARSVSGDTEPMMLIGQDFLRAHRVLVANREHALLFSYLGGPVFATPAVEPKPAPPPAH